MQHFYKYTYKVLTAWFLPFSCFSSIFIHLFTLLVVTVHHVSSVFRFWWSYQFQSGLCQGTFCCLVVFYYTVYVSLLSLLFIVLQVRFFIWRQKKMVLWWILLGSAQNVSGNHMSLGFAAFVISQASLLQFRVRYNVRPCFIQASVFSSTTVHFIGQRLADFLPLHLFVTFQYFILLIRSQSTLLCPSCEVNRMAVDRDGKLLDPHGSVTLCRSVT